MRNETTKQQTTRLQKTRRCLGELMGEFLETRVEPYVQESTYRSYLQGLQANFYPEPIASLRVREFTAEAVSSYFSSLLARKSRRTVEIMASLLKRFSSYLYERRLIREDVAAGVPLPREKRRDFSIERKGGTRKRVLSHEDIRKFYDAYRSGDLPVTDSVKAYLPVILLQLETFLRAGEVVSIFEENVDLAENVLWVRNSVGTRYRGNDITKPLERYVKLPKNGEARVVPLSPLAREIVLLMKKKTKEHGQNPQGLLYPFLESGKMRSVSSYERSFRLICEALSIDRDVTKTDCAGRSYGLNTHALRHTGITLANTADGANPINTALMAGHTLRNVGGQDLGVESVYIHAVLPALRRVKTPSMILGLGNSRDPSPYDVAGFLQALAADRELEFTRILRTLAETHVI